MRNSGKLSEATLNAVAGPLLALIMLLQIHRYGGIDHDAPLYLGQALRILSPDIFNADLFFSHGSQSSYTLFPWLTAYAMKWVDPAVVFMLGSLAGILIFSFASWFCLGAILEGRQRYWSFLAVICLPSMYGMILIFSYNEAFLTPRPFAEAFVLMAIGMAVRRRWIFAGLMLLVGGVIHPLQVISALLIIWPWAILQNRRWLHIAWCSLPILAAAAAGVRPFDGLLRTLSPTWMADLHEFTGQIFLNEWGSVDFKNVAFDLFILAVGWYRLRGKIGGWCVAAAVGICLGLLSSLVLVDGLNLVLPAGLQLWRAQWLGHWFAIAAIGALLFQDAMDGKYVRALSLGMAAILAWQLEAWVWPLPGLLYLAWPTVESNIKPRVQMLLCFMLVVGMAVSFAGYVASEMFPFRMAHYRLELYAFDRRLLAYPLVSLGLPLIGLAVWGGMSRLMRIAVVSSVLLPLLVLSIARWDGRSPLKVALESHSFSSKLFGVEIPRKATVFWDADPLVGTWLVMNRASYFSLRQLSGIVFNKETSIEGRERIGKIRGVVNESLYCQDHSVPLDVRKNCRISEKSMRHACAAGLVARPDYMVLPYRQPQKSMGSWSIMDPATGEPAITYWLYDCDMVARGLLE